MEISRLNTITPAQTTLLICDIQEKFKPAIKNFSRCAKVTARLIFACEKFGIKCLITEQYPKGLGKTDHLIRAAIEESKIKSETIEKTKFSMLTDETKGFLKLEDDQNPAQTNSETPKTSEPKTPKNDPLLTDNATTSNPPQTFIITGLEAHICVYQTCCDLLTQNAKHQIFLVADAVASRSDYDKTFALKRLAKLGVVVLTHESLIFDLLGDKNHANFKFCSSLVREILHECSE